ncbi:DUF6443 domain-containing protein [Mucilaginibacter sp. OK098]|uniref:DUF6443 domain-containing protein n=1 Tax=Mucilaginibacter sp. OK098 TaxID=1855297 RepID=UPI000922F0C1|nr:DUF6443 domain-containing protein [Mucilaginibacter sp. OK098]SHM67346.1 RHS repeat-associated core domain-containing protein [Mucilaginibacter sp. OK098]
MKKTIRSSTAVFISIMRSRFAKSIVLLLSFSLIGECTLAQIVRGPLVLSSPNTTGDHGSDTRVTLSPGFRSTAPFSAFIQQIVSPSQSMNYVLTYSPRVPVTDLSTLPLSTTANVNKSIAYFDGLGRPVQTVDVQASPTQRDLVQPKSYDQFDRESTTYLPYSVLPTVSSDGSFKTTAIADEASFYASPSNVSTWNAPGVVSTGYPFETTGFEVSPLNRATEQGSYGDSWQLTGTSGDPHAGHTAKIAYASNNAANLTSGTGFWAKNYGVNYVYTVDGNYLYKNTLSDLGSYPANTLYVRVTKNQNWSSSQTNLKWNTVEEYRDKSQQLILKRTYNYNTSTSQTEISSTYYVYDDYGNLTYVLPTGATPDDGVTQADLDTWCYQYRYDGRNRLIGKKSPSKGWELTLYNKLDQVVATQDSVQRTKSPQEWTIIKYDGVGRSILSGIYQYAGSVPGTDYRLTLQNLVDAQTNQWETPTTSGNGYSATTWPTSWSSTLYLNYYDNYVNNPVLPYTYSSGSTMTRGLQTASKTSILSSATDALWTQNYYDDQNRINKSFQQHYLGGIVSVNNYDEITDRYDFTGNVLSSTRKQYSNGTGNVLTLNVTVRDSFKYDHIGRKTKSFMQVDAGVNVLLANYIYNEVGQSYLKKLHSEDGGSNFIETVTSSYNPRGWMAETSSANFDEKLYFDTPSGAITGAVGTFTGAIAEAWYNSANVANKGFSYLYDNSNRLISSKYYQGTNYIGNLDETINYDPSGNILSLQRGNNGALPYVYSGTFNYSSYTGNQLNTVSNNGSAYRSFAYDANGNTTSSGSYSFDYNLLNLPNHAMQNGTAFNTYVYDSYGNKLRKISALSGTTDYISGIQYKNGVIDFIATDEGRYVNNGAPSYQYDLKDHLGNIRVVIQKKTATSATNIQDQEYYAFGLNVTNYDNSSNNKYLYNGKEIQDESNLNQYDYGARFYDPVIARWTSPDLLSDDYDSVSPYGYAENNPVLNTDPYGLWTQTYSGWTTNDPDEIQDFYNYLKYTHDRNVHVSDGQDGSGEDNEAFRLFGASRTHDYIFIFYNRNNQAAAKRNVEHAKATMAGGSAFAMTAMADTKGPFVEVGAFIGSVAFILTADAALNDLVKHHSDQFSPQDIQLPLPSRQEALRRAKDHAQVSRKTGQDLPMDVTRPSSRGRNWEEMKARGANKVGRQDTIGGNFWRDDPDGHPDSLEDGIPDYHKYPHIHSTNRQGEERVFPYDNN